MPSVKVNGVRINYVQVDCESGTPCEDLVMIHGLATNMAFWYFHHVPEFSKRYRITLYDLRGHGRSEMTDSGYTPVNMAIDLQQLLDHLCIERAHIIAHSFGGLVALNLAGMDPDRFASLMLVDTNINTLRRFQKRIRWKFAQKVHSILNQHGIDIDTKEPYFGYKLLSAAAHLRMHARSKKISQELEALVDPLMGKRNKRTATQWLKLMETTQAEKELMGSDGLTIKSLRKLTFPILAMYGEYSHTMSTGKQLLKVWSHADFRRIREAGHFFPITQPSVFMKNWQKFFNGSPVTEPPCREGDSGRRYFRSDRFFNREGQWFFYTRESTEEGPFDDLEEAKSYFLNNRSIMQEQCFEMV